MCKVRGHLDFNRSVLSTTKGFQKIDMDKLPLEESVFTIRLQSKDQNCLLDLEADVKVLEDDSPVKGLMYYLYVFFLLMVIVGSGFKLIFESMRNGDFNKSVSIYVISLISCLDFFFTVDFFMQGGTL